jgi:hypothetical protein
LSTEILEFTTGGAEDNVREAIKNILEIKNTADPEKLTGRTKVLFINKMNSSRPRPSLKIKKGSNLIKEGRINIKLKDPISEM